MINTDLHLKPNEDGTFTLIKSFVLDGIKVPKNFKTNGADIPRIFWSICPPNNPKYLKAVVIHDYMTSLSNDTYDFKNANLIFRKNMTENTTAGKLTAELFYYGVEVYRFLKYNILCKF